MNVTNLFEGDDRAVSPVIGVILMVAITVILAAVIGTFVLGLGDSLSGGVQAGVAVDQSSGSTSITYTSAGSADRITFQGANSSGNLNDLTDVGNSTSSTSLNSGEDLQIIAVSGDEQTVIRTVTITDEGIGG